MPQLKQSQWYEQWEMFQDEELFLFKDWIYPVTLDDFKNKDVLEAGCGGGQHTSFIAPNAKRITAVDLNTVNIAQQRNIEFNNINFIEADIAEMDLGKQFDIVFCVGVIHHTSDPEKTVKNLKKHLKSGGTLIVWVYSIEGNYLVRTIVEPLRKLFFHKMNRKNLLLISKIITGLMYIPIYSLYRLPLYFLPYYEYFENFRKMSFERNTLNVFDKLNAPQVDFISYERIKHWFPDQEFATINLSSYKGVSWRGSGIKRCHA
jgi:SAM-dependent methyltransferase